jgi:hypothetical protein
MTINSRILAIAGGLLMAVTAAQPSIAQKRGGILKMYTPDSPASMSVLEEATVFSRGPMMGVFNNLVMFDQQVKQNSLQSRYAIAEATRGLFRPSQGHAPARAASKAQQFSFQISAVSAF